MTRTQSSLAATLAIIVLAAPAPPADEVTFKPIKYDAFTALLTKNPTKAKFSVMDVWASNCAPCKENFPHLVEMNAKYAGKGLAVLSMSLDDIEDGAALKNAEKFLKEKHARFANYYMDEEFGVGFDKLDIGAIPAVFLYGPDGKLLRKFTMEDPDNQFTYEEVEEAVKAVLAGKPLPPEKGAKPKG